MKGICAVFVQNIGRNVQSKVAYKNDSTVVFADKIDSLSGSSISIKCVRISRGFHIQSRDRQAHQSEAAWRNTDRNGIVHRWIQWSMCRWMFQLHCWHCKLRHSDMDHSSMDQLQQKTSALLQQRKPNISPRRQHEPMGRTGLSVVTFRD